METENEKIDIIAAMVQKHPDLEAIKNEFYGLIQFGTSFADLEGFLKRNGHIDKSLGTQTLHAGYDNLIEWVTDNALVLAIYFSLAKEGKIVITNAATDATLLCYFIDGMGLNLPIAHKAKSYKTPHWFPILFSRTDDAEKRHVPYAPINVSLIFR